MLLYGFNNDVNDKLSLLHIPSWVWLFQKPLKDAQKGEILYDYN